MYISVAQIELKIWLKTKRVNFLTFALFAILYRDFVTFLQKSNYGKKFFFTYFIIPPKLLYQSFWPLSWILTLGANTFMISSKMWVYFFYPYFSNKVFFVFFLSYHFKFTINHIFEILQHLSEGSRDWKIRKARSTKGELNVSIGCNSKGHIVILLLFPLLQIRVLLPA